MGTPPAAPDATIAYAAGGDTAGPPAIRLQVGGAEVSGDLPALLRHRLRGLAVVLAGLYTYLVARWWLVGWADDWTPDKYTPVMWATAALLHLNLAWHAAAAVALTRGPRLPLARLRLVELGVAGLPLLSLCVLDVDLLFDRRTLARYAAGTADPYLTPLGQTLPWFAWVVGYGVYVPNTWRRCMAVVWAVVTTALGLTAAAAVGQGLLADPAVARHWLAMAAWLGVAVALAVFNASRIDVLRETAAAARRLGQYRLTRRLGAGGMGEVYLAEHALLRRPCAVKLIRPDRAGDPAALARFEREVQATAALAHPHVVRVYDYGRADDGTFYCVTEYLSGVTLDELVRRHGPLPPDRAVYLLRQVCGALAEAHAAGLTHRDVKPGNVIVCDRGRQADAATLLDFGLVLDRQSGDDRVTRDGAVVGTPAYMAPEQAGGGAVGPAADVYAVGAVGHFLLTGQPPFAGGSVLATLAAVLTQPPPAVGRADVPAGLEGVLRRCLAKRPEDRFGSADEVDAALAGCGCSGWSAARAAAWWVSRGPDGPAATSERTVALT